MYVDNLKVEIVREDVLRQIDCREDSVLYEEIVEEYEEIVDGIYALCEPVFLLEEGIIGKELSCENLVDGTSVFYALYSIGGNLSALSTKYFQKGDYLKGMLVDAMADSALFSLEKSMEPYLMEACASFKKGIQRRLEAPQDLPMEAQKVILEQTKGKERCGIDISSGYMLDPVKSNAVIYVLTDDKELFRHQHDCRNCDRVDCKLRKIPDVPVKVLDAERSFVINVKENQSILEALNAADPSFGAVCGGKGSCGKCKIQVLKGRLAETEFDQRCFNKEELVSGMRLSCKAYPTEPLEIRLEFRGDEKFQVVGLEEFVEKRTGMQDESFGIAVDLGTTTIAMQLVALKTREVCAVHTAVNHQRIYGADVIARIKASTDGKKDALRKSIQKDLQEGFYELIKKAGIVNGSVKEIVIAGNTTMGHLLMGYDCSSLGVFPFTPVNIDLIEETYENVFEDDSLSAKVTLLPGISAFVGADIAAGAYQCEMYGSEQYSMLVDLGTNGEIILGNSRKMIATSTAAGPAFEGGNIAWGVGSIEGAICGAKFEEGVLQIQTIGNKEPVGICGTGVLELVAELLKEELIDETGYLCEEYFEEGYPVAQTSRGEQIVLTQKDIREVQLAKAAVRAGIETLILRYGIEKQKIDHVYIAGGFGNQLDCRKVMALGMIPEEFTEKIEAVGNSALYGAKKSLIHKEERTLLCQMTAKVEEINLSSDKDFNQLYMDAMYFE